MKTAIESIQLLYVLGLPCLLAYTLQRYWVGRLGEPRPVGDEGDYVQRASAADPFAPRLFLRVPLLPLLSWLGGRVGAADKLLRDFSEIAATATVLNVTAALWVHSDAAVALAVGSVFAILPSRLIYARRIWPDVYLGFFLSCALLLVAATGIDSGFDAGLAGAVCALAFLTRFDALLLAPAMWLASANPADPVLAAAIMGPTLLSALALAAFNRHRYGVFIPDNTWSFNLLASSREALHCENGAVAVESTMRDALSVWKDHDLDNRSRFGLDVIRRNPVRILSGALERMVALLGPDTFARQRLLAAHAPGYEDPDEDAASGLRTVLRFEFPMITGVAVFTMMLGGVHVPSLLPTLSLAAGAVFVARTRYRQAWLPGLAVLAGTSIHRISVEPPPAGALGVSLILVIGLAMALSRLRLREET